MINFAVIGVGRMGRVHAHNLLKGKVKGARLVAICDIKQDVLNSLFDNDLKAKSSKLGRYLDYKTMLKKENIQAVVIATEHYFHADIAIYCMEKGINTLVEKPLSVTTLDAKRMIECAKSHPKLKTVVMFNQRTNPNYKRAKEIIENDVIGKVQRANYIITDWYRSQAYYDQGGWRASLWGEGGGALINQCIHQIDLVQWIMGMPSNVRAKTFTKGRDITTENDITASFAYPDNVFCTFQASTHELRGTNRLEIAGDKGRIVIDGFKMKVYTFKNSEPYVNKNTKYGYGVVTRKTKRYNHTLGFLLGMILGQQINILRNFANAINYDEKLISPMIDGLNAVEILNAMYMSSWSDKEVEIPINDKDYVEMLSAKINDEKIILGDKNDKN